MLVLEQLEKFINLQSLLCYMKIDILQYLSKETKVKVNKKILNTLFNGKKLSEWSRSLSIPLKNLSRYKNCTRALPLVLFNHLIKLSRLSLSELQNKMELKINPMGKYLKIGPHIKINENWIYVSELIKGDGYITPNFWYINFVNQNIVLIDYVKNFFLSLGLNKKRISIIRREDVNFLIIRSSLLAYLLNRVLDVPIGRKKEINISDFVLENKKFWIAAIRGAFDAEGSVTSIGSRRISISSNSKLWINKLHRILDNLKIKSTIYEETKGRDKPIYRLFVHHIINLRRFYNLIKPLHTKRKTKLKEIIQKGHNRNPKELYYKKILKAIKKGRLRRKDIEEELNQKLILVSNNIYRLRKKGLIVLQDKIYTNRGCFFRYKLTSRGEKFLKGDLSSFFD